MPENTISSTANGMKVDVDRSHNRQEARNEQRVQLEPTVNKSGDKGVEVSISSQARELNLSSPQVVSGAGQIEKRARTESEQESPRALSDSADTNPSDEPRLISETGESGSVTQQFSPSANDTLGTVIDIRS